MEMNVVSFDLGYLGIRNKVIFNQVKMDI